MHHTVVYTESTFERVSRLISLFVLAPVLLALALPVAVNIYQKPDFGFKVHRLVVVSVTPDGPADQSGLAVDDRILAVNGTPTTRMHEYYAAKTGHAVGQLLTIQVAGPDNAERLLHIRPVQTSQSDMIHGYSTGVVGLGFLFIGWWVLWRRTDPVARNFFSLCLIFAFFLLDIPDHGNHSYMYGKDLLRTFLFLLLPAFFLRFFLQFPSPKRKESGEPIKYRLLLLPAWILFLLIAGLDKSQLTAAGSTAEQVIEIISTFYALGYFLAGLIIFGRRVLRRDRPIQQTKMKVVLVGLIGGLVPFLAAMIVGNFLPGSHLPHWQYLAMFLLLVPVSFGLAIMRYGALDTGFIVRISLVYGLLTVMVLLGYFLTVGLVGKLVAGVFGADTWPVMVVIAAASGLAIMPLRSVVQSWLDNNFYPARRANRRAINLLAEKLTGLIDPQDVVSAIQDNLCTLYRPEGFALFLPTSSPKAGFLARLRGQCAEHPVAESGVPEEAFLSQDSGLAHLLNRLRRPVFREEIEDHMFAGEADPASLQLLTRLNIALVVPLITGNRLLGFMAFGPKRSGALFSQDDLANLRSLAVQAASLVESRQLYQASLERKRLETELEVARDIQANLLPDSALNSDHYHISGRNEPCRKVGGDYFDYFTLDNGDLCFAIADVSGKGIPASLMMTSVRVAFRQEAVPGISPRVLITKLNEVVTGLGSQGHFICFFCGIWRPSTGLLRFCNAGMEPPVLFRPRTRYRQDLKKGGTVLGIEKESRYREGAIGLEPGDRLFLYTDGLTEETNAADEFFDTPRLLELVHTHLDDTPDALLGKVFSHVNAFGGAERSDDRTAILLEIKDLKI
ncbi:MAG: SpoIIE family protein phosphatase [Candidatus Krumholzibacteria bacterium]|nr:SpoIIE family protein phosphatase [Candidatus Krumholzibacteria bacterium]